MSEKFAVVVIEIVTIVAVVVVIVEVVAATALEVSLTVELLKYWLWEK